MEISIFKNIKESKGKERTTIQDFLSHVKFGKWQAIAEKINGITEKEKRQEAKKNGVPYVTISGTFDHRSAKNLINHSGFICIDIDDVDDVQEIKEKLESDPFTYSCFKSISGKGLAVLVRIDESRHLDAFLGLEYYYAEKYEVSIDRSCKDASRARFVSYDSELFQNEKAKKFTNYVPKSQQIKKTKLPNVIIGSNDMTHIMDQIQKNSLDLTGDSYRAYLNIGFALAAEFGEGGRSYYHNACYYGQKYDAKKCDRQFDSCLKSSGSGVNFSTFLHYAKEAGVSIVSQETKHISTAANMGRNAGRGISEIVKTLKEVDGMSAELTKPIIEKVFAREDLGDGNKLSKIDALELFINQYNLKRNEITRIVNSYGKEVDTQFLNTLWIKALKEVDSKTRFDEIDRFIGSDYIESYNPLKEFFEANQHITPEGNIKALCDCITSRNEYKELFITKWLVGIIESVYGGHSPLLLALTGGQNAGKTEFFRRLLPAELKGYYAESKLDAAKDDEILMTQKILILDDEFGGKSKAEAKKLKEITSKENFTLREPYGRRNVTLKRLAVLAGTSNDPKLLNDPTGNRRVIPIQVDEMDFNGYNSIDKTHLIMEAYHLYKSGYKWKLNKEEIKFLNDNTNQFEQASAEKEMLLQFFRLPNFDSKNIVNLQLTEIKSQIEKSSLQKINIHRLSQELRRLGFKEKTVNIFGNNQNLYEVVRISEEQQISIRERGGDHESKVESLAF